MYPDAPDSEGFVPLIAMDGLAPGRVQAFVVHGWPIILVRTGEHVHALLNRCSHAAAPLDEARVRRDFLICPLHGAQFDLATGTCRSTGSGYLPIRTFPIRVEDGMIAVQIPRAQPTVDDLPLRP